MTTLDEIMNEYIVFHAEDIMNMFVIMGTNQSSHKSIVRTNGGICYFTGIKGMTDREFDLMSEALDFNLGFTKLDGLPNNKNVTIGFVSIKDVRLLDDLYEQFGVFDPIALSGRQVAEYTETGLTFSLGVVSQLRAHINQYHPILRDEIQRRMERILSQKK